ncbi:MAG TPA: creatininase family protein [Dysgonamonadaceae bacterium]|nr:creatininase family protein [Dysgonamonadaceae bacterium]
MIDLSKLSWGDIKENCYDVVILPWGAIEPHNYHMPYLTDAYLSHEIAKASATLAWEKADKLCMVMPPIYLGSQNPGQWDLPFCIHTNYETQKAILTDIVNSLYVQGFRKLLIVNGHGGNTFKSMIRDLAMKLPEFFILASNWFDIIPKEDFFEAEIDDHAGEQETSVLMHYLPELVKMQKAGKGTFHPWEMESMNKKTAWAPRNWKQVSDDTGIGNPEKSSSEKGKRYATEVVKRIADLLIELANN